MKLKFKAPNFLKRKASEVISETASRELEGDFHIRINEAEIGMRDKKAYFNFSIEGDMDRRDIMKLIKMAMNEGL